MALAVRLPQIPVRDVDAVDVWSSAVPMSWQG